MRNLWKRTLALVLAFLCVLACVGCGEKPAAPETTAATKPAPTEPEGEAEVLKVLTLGHSLAVNATRMLNLVAHAEGYKEMKIGTLYYSGCPLYRHVEFLTNDSPEYALYISSTETPDLPPEVMESVTMLQAIKFDYWDIIIMQGGVFELAKAETFTGLAGIGDLIVTCTSMHSRNCRAGMQIGQGIPVADAVSGTNGSVVEGYYAAASAKALAAKTGVEMPITEGAYEVLYEGKDPHIVLTELMTRKKRQEPEGELSWI